MTMFDEQAVEAAAGGIYETWLAAQGGEQILWVEAVAIADKFGPEKAPEVCRIVNLCRKEAKSALAAAEESLRERGMVREGNASDPCDQWFAQAPVIADGGETFPVAIIQIKEPTA